MKLIAMVLSLSALAYSNVCSAQLTVTINGFPANDTANVFYRGFNNVLIVDAEVGFAYTSWIPRCGSSEVKSSNNDLHSESLIQTGKGASTSITFYEKGVSDAFRVIPIQIKHLPDPVLFFDDVPSGGVIRKTASQFRVGYPEGTRLNSSFRIVKVALSTKNSNITCNGSSIDSLMKNLMTGLESGDTISIIAVILCSDGISRRIAGVFTIE